MVGGLRGLPAGSVGERTLLGERGWLVEVGSLGLGGGFPVESRRRLEGSHGGRGRLDRERVPWCPQGAVLRSAASECRSQGFRSVRFLVVDALWRRLGCRSGRGRLADSGQRRVVLEGGWALSGFSRLVVGPGARGARRVGLGVSGLGRLRSRDGRCFGRFGSCAGRRPRLLLSNGSLVRRGPCRGPALRRMSRGTISRLVGSLGRAGLARGSTRVLGRRRARGSALREAARARGFRLAWIGGPPRRGARLCASRGRLRFPSRGARPALLAHEPGEAGLGGLVRGAGAGLRRRLGGGH